MRPISCQHHPDDQTPHLYGEVGSGSHADGEMACEHCGEPRFLELFEAWGAREFMFETCCYALHEEVTQIMNDDPEAGALLLQGMGVDELLGRVSGSKVRRVIDNQMGQLVIDWNLEIDETVPFSRVKAFVAEHHRHCPPPAGWRFGAAVMNGRELIGVIVVGRPVARAFDSKEVVEVNRLCVRDDIAPCLVWNACSLLYGWAARQAKKRGFSRIITYTLASESATTLKAVGWAQEATVKGRSWNTASRPREDKAPTEDKIRWGKVLKKAAQPALAGVAGPKGSRKHAGAHAASSELAVAA